ncbi:PPE domain-containing protein [Nocardia sp. NPDC050710]|uniref:PPE domain-containing protein n=1 Tax=Nocardia sp. NPDC050710 TaxID=3157220 RepID=UPI0033F52C99
MIEPPRPGFTDVVWEAREPDRLARDLTTGPGAIPMAEAGAAWAKLAADFGTAAVEYELVIAAIRGAWQSSTSRDVLERITGLRDWLSEAASAATANAVRAETQAAAYELARLTMPNTADIAAIQQVQRMLDSIGAALGAPIRAVAAQTDADADVAKAAASRVMRTYEAATEPLAMPWEHQQPPVLASEAALDAERAGANVPVGQTPVPPMGFPGMGIPSLGGFVAAAREKTAYRTPVLVQSETPQTVETVTPHAVPTTHPASMPLVPAAMAPGAAAAQEEEYESRAGDAGVDVLGPELGIVSAPAVLGAPEPPAAAGPVAAGGAA